MVSQPCVDLNGYNSGQTDMFLGQQKCPIAPPQLIRQLLSSTMIDNSAICMMLLTGCLYFCMLVGVLWFRNRALTSKDNSGQTDMFLGQHKCPIAPPQRAPQLVGVKWMLVDLWWCVFLRHVDASASCLVDLCCYSKIVGLVVTTLFSESDAVWCVVCCAESQCWFALKGTWSVYIYTFDPKTVNLYKYIPLIPRLWIWASSISTLVAVASAVVGIDQYSYAFDPETVDRYNYLWSQDCGSI